jgi:glycosyltransferase involved in cell wall biosynthesis
MRIALVTTIKPVKDSGNGGAEYAHALYECLSRGNDVDVVYALESPRRNDVGGLAYTNTLFKAKVKLLASEAYDIVHVTDQELGFVAKILHGRTSAKIVTTVHDLERFRKELYRGFVQKAYNEIVKRNIISALRYSDGILCNSSQTLEDVKAVFGTPKRCMVVSHPVKPSVLKAASPIRKRHGTFTIGYIGALAYHKNVMLLLKAAKLMKNEKAYRFMVYGTGTEHDSLVDYKNRNGLDNVEFPGFADEKRIAQIYDSFDVFVFPSMCEGMGLPILEAQSRGLPTIIYSKGRITEEVARYCFKARDERQMAQIIRRLHTKGYSEKGRKKETAYAREFSDEATAGKTFEFYKSVLAHQH